jgi:hypothetical protein
MVKEWEKECKSIKKQHTKLLISKNAKLILEGKPSFHLPPALPPKPYLHVFLPKEAIREMVKECLKKSALRKYIK